LHKTTIQKLKCVFSLFFEMKLLCRIMGMKHILIKYNGFLIEKTSYTSMRLIIIFDKKNDNLRKILKNDQKYFNLLNLY
jgi:hypothetical protein